MYCVAHGNITGLDTSVSVLKAHIPLLHDLELKNVDSLWSVTVQSLIINWSLGFIFFPPLTGMQSASTVKPNPAV